MKTTVSERGQITLPKEIRTSMGIRPGSIIDFVFEDGRIVGRKMENVDPIDKWRGRGVLPAGADTVDAYIGESRE